MWADDILRYLAHFVVDVVRLPAIGTLVIEDGHRYLLFEFLGDFGQNPIRSDARTDKKIHEFFKISKDPAAEYALRNQEGRAKNNLDLTGF